MAWREVFTLAIAMTSVSPCVMVDFAQFDPLQQGIPLPRPVANNPTVDAEIRELWDSARAREIPISDKLQGILQRLGSDDFKTRNAASAELIGAGISLEEMFAALRRGGLQPEQRERLLAAIKFRLLDSPRGAMGIRMGGDFGVATGVLIEDVIEGMPAAKHLRPGDRIESIGGESVKTRGDLGGAIQRRKPGESVRLVILRPTRDAKGKALRGPDGKALEERLEVDITLAAVSDLERFEQSGRSGIERFEQSGRTGIMSELQQARLAAFEEAVQALTPAPVIVAPEPDADP